jgi:hypothetical protein
MKTLLLNDVDEETPLRFDLAEGCSGDMSESQRIKAVDHRWRVFNERLRQLGVTERANIGFASEAESVVEISGLPLSMQSAVRKAFASLLQEEPLSAEVWSPLIVYVDVQSAFQKADGDPDIAKCIRLFMFRMQIEFMNSVNIDMQASDRGVFISNVMPEDTQDIASILEEWSKQEGSGVDNIHRDW